MVEVFKTNIRERQQAAFLFEMLAHQFPSFKINFDLDDCDRILRVEGEEVSNQQIISIINKVGYQCQPLE